MTKRKDSFLNFVLISLGFHAVILALLTVKVLFFPSEVPDHQKAVRIDVVALPEKQTETPKPIVKKPEQVKTKQKTKVKPKTKPKPKPVVKKKPVLPKPKKKKLKKKVERKKVKEEQNSALARLKALQKLKEEKQKTQTVEFKGNQVSKGNSLTGLSKLHHQDYLDQLDSHIRSFWNLPEWLASGNLKASVLLLINKNGLITGKSFVTKSGNDLFDQHVFSTLEKASPLPTPPASLIDFYRTKGVEIRFPD